MTLDSQEKKEVSMDFSTMSDFLKCRKRGYYRHILNIVPDRTSKALVFGGAMHEALASWYQFRDEGKAIREFSNYWNAHVPPPTTPEEGKISLQPQQEDPKRNLVNGVNILSGYFKAYPKEPFQILSNEFPFKVFLGQIEGVSYYLTGKVDLTVRWNGMTYIMDHKTTSMLGGSFFKQFHPSLQLDGYAYAVKDIFGECDGVLINAILVAKTKQTFERDIFSKTEEDLELYVENALQIMWEIEQAKKADRYVINTDACTLYGECPYLELCQAKGDEMVINKRYKVEVWDPFMA